MIKICKIIALICSSFSIHTSFGKGGCTLPEKTPLREGPSTQADLLWDVPHLTPLKILKEKGNWYQVQDSEKINFWVRKNHISRKLFCGSVKIEKTLRRGKPHYKSKARKGPSHFLYDSNLKIIEFKGVWAKVQNPQGKEEAWIKRKHLWVQ